MTLSPNTRGEIMATCLDTNNLQLRVVRLFHSRRFLYEFYLFKNRTTYRALHPHLPDACLS
jgi:hypothetical protein